jgi:maleate isomerase
MDQGRHHRAKLGFVVLSMEQTVEDDVVSMRPAGVGVHFTRVRMSNGVTMAAVSAMSPHIFAASSLLLPDDRPDVLCYTCNAGTMVMGEAEVMQLMDPGHRARAVTTVMTGVVRALTALEAKRLAIVTPYTDEVNQVVQSFMSSYGFQFDGIRGMNIDKNSDIDRVTPSFIKRYAKLVQLSDVDAIFLCCGALRSLDIVQDLERETGRPVICSNQAMMWDCLRLAGVDDRIAGFGTLFDHSIDSHAAAVEKLRTTGIYSVIGRWAKAMLGTSGL